MVLKTLKRLSIILLIYIAIEVLIMLSGHITPDVGPKGEIHPFMALIMTPVYMLQYLWLSIVNLSILFIIIFIAYSFFTREEEKKSNTSWANKNLSSYDISNYQSYLKKKIKLSSIAAGLITFLIFIDIYFLNFTLSKSGITNALLFILLGFLVYAVTIRCPSCYRLSIRKNKCSVCGYPLLEK